MAVLTRNEIFKRIDNGEIIIEPFEKNRVGPASVDLTLDSTFRVFKNVHELVHLRSDDFDVDAVSERIEVRDFFTLLPGQTVLGITVEKITLPPTLCGWIQGRSRFARIGLMVHITASFIQPGVSNKQVLEMSNAGPMPLALHPGVAICQLILEEVKGEGRYAGTFVDQSLP